MSKEDTIVFEDKTPIKKQVKKQVKKQGILKIKAGYMQAIDGVFCHDGNRQKEKNSTIIQRIFKITILKFYLCYLTRNITHVIISI